MSETDPTEVSLAEILAAGALEELDEFLAGLSELEAEALQYEWDFLARPKQQWPAGDWTTWAIIAGRGFGKTWTGAHATRRVAESAEVPIIHLIAPTPADYRDVMIEGPAGLQAISPKWSRPEFFPSKRLLVWPNGVHGLCFSAEDPEALRGPQCGFIWHDEPGAWTYGEPTWDQSQFGLRIQPKAGPVLGGIPRQVMTTTPKPFKWLKAILADPTTHLTTGTTYENLNNLADAFKRAVIRKYEGTTLGKQELLAQLLEAVQGALWTPELIENTRVHALDETRPRCVVAVDPAATSTEDSDETGIVVACSDTSGELYVIEDATPGRVSPTDWARAAVSAYYRHRADLIVAETNNGGDMVLATIRNIDPNVRVDKVTATRGKATRAEPISALFEQNRAHLLGTHPKLEEQLTQWVPGGKESSPDRLDAMVWALTALSAGRRARLIA